MSVLLGKEQECEERLGYSDKAANASQSPPSPMAVQHGQTDLHTKKGGKKGKLFSQNRNTFHLESLIWVSDKAENTFQSIYNPLAFGGLEQPQHSRLQCHWAPGRRGLERPPTPGCNGSAHKKGKKKVNCFL